MKTTATKKKAPEGAKGRGQTREQLKARAAEIIPDVCNFDADTRRAVHLALGWLRFAESGAEPPTPLTEPGRCERELREAIRNAETGVPAFDVDRLTPQAVAQARAVYAMLDGGDGVVDLPDYITGAVMVALDATAKDAGVEIWLDVDDSGDLEVGGYSVARIATLFNYHPTSGVAVEPKRDLAGLISAVLTHADVPERVYDKLTDALVELHDSTDVYGDERAVRALLDYHAKKAEEDGGEG